MEVFGDTSYFLALLMRNDRAHGKAEDYARNYRGTIVTSAWIITEILDGLSSLAWRRKAVLFVDSLIDDPGVKIVPLDTGLHREACELYKRSDKEWSLTDCVSFAIMQQHGIHVALTLDRDFVQAGFTAPLISQ